MMRPRGEVRPLRSGAWRAPRRCGRPAGSRPAGTRVRRDARRPNRRGSTTRAEATADGAAGTNVRLRLVSHAPSCACPASRGASRRTATRPPAAASRPRGAGEMHERQPARRVRELDVGDRVAASAARRSWRAAGRRTVQRRSASTSIAAERGSLTVLEADTSAPCEIRFGAGSRSRCGEAQRAADVLLVDDLRRPQPLRPERRADRVRVVVGLVDRRRAIGLAVERLDGGVGVGAVDEAERAASPVPPGQAPPVVAAADRRGEPPVELDFVLP